ncbi:hypothetical protein CPB84DRAFT_1959466 [Gymnopilus junonius]|uniref:Uncharacterized protein n=1 Tax=Gymnopilus junonius TaxID=109634 RepID=A0A9P5TRS6_GYMJU|nr:hypothetical protein CPB84DRAFT_1959466 [Gymnopilus junonius]
MLSSRPLQLTTDAPYFSTKTPGRGLKNRAENAYPGMGMPMTVNGKGKNANKAPRTPFQPASAQPHRPFKDQKIVLKSTGRPLSDRTPLPNRVGTTLFKTPLPGNSKLSKLRCDGDQIEEDSGTTPDSAQRPSSLRKHIKHPRISGRSALETPMNNGNHWDVSDGDIVLPDAQPVLEETIAEAGDDLDELEYGPPNTLDIAYEPPFDFVLPNYKEVGKTLFDLAHSTPYDDVAPVEIEISPCQIGESKWDFISLPELASDDPFHVARAQMVSENVKNAPPVLPSRRGGISSSNTITGVTRPQSSKTRVGVAPTARRPAGHALPATAVVNTKRTVFPTVAKSTSASSIRKATEAKELASLRTLPSSTGSSMKDLPLSKLRPSALQSTPAAGRAPIPRPTSRMTNPSVLAGRTPAPPRRPHTSLATNVNSHTASSTKKVPQPTSKEDDVVIIKDNDADIDMDLDFKFDV